jgi:hypothetical protein
MQLTILRIKRIFYSDLRMWNNLSRVNCAAFNRFKIYKTLDFNYMKFLFPYFPLILSIPTSTISYRLFIYFIDFLFILPTSYLSYRFLIYSTDFLFILSFSYLFHRFFIYFIDFPFISPIFHLFHRLLIHPTDFLFILSISIFLIDYFYNFPLSFINFLFLLLIFTVPIDSVSNYYSRVIILIRILKILIIERYYLNRSIRTRNDD